MKKYDHYLSFGMNCEVGFALEDSSILTPSLFTWADIRGSEALVGTLKNFDSLFSEGIIRYGGNMFFCEKSRIGFHGRLKFSDAKNDDGTYDENLICSSLLELRSRLEHLRNRQYDYLINCKVLIVLKYMSDIFSETKSVWDFAHFVSKEIKEYYGLTNLDLLCVSDVHAAFPLFDASDIFFRQIPEYSPRSDARKIDVNSWRILLSEFI